MQTLKTYLIAFALTFCFFTGLSGQVTYQHYFNNSYQWFETQSAYQFPSSYPPCYSNGGDFYLRYRYHIIGTDSVDGFFWYKIHADSQQEIDCGSGPPTIYPPVGYPGPSFRIREDSTGKIWLRQNDSTIALMYDFPAGISLGDTLWMNDNQDYCEVKLIDSVSLGTELRARYWCEDCGSIAEPNRDVYIIEGVGLNQGFMSTYLACDAYYDSESGLSCCQKNGATLNIHPTFLCNTPIHLIVGLEDEVASEMKLVWHSESERIVVKDLDPLQARAWAVYDVQGKLLAKGNALTEEVYLPGLVPGMYILVVEPSEKERAFSWRFLR
jgi:hypothetical protein